MVTACLYFKGGLFDAIVYANFWKKLESGQVLFIYLHFIGNNHLTK